MKKLILLCTVFSTLLMGWKGSEVVRVYNFTRDPIEIRINPKERGRCLNYENWEIKPIIIEDKKSLPDRIEYVPRKIDFSHTTTMFSVQGSQAIKIKIESLKKSTSLMNITRKTASWTVTTIVSGKAITYPTFETCIKYIEGMAVGMKCFGFYDKDWKIYQCNYPAGHDIEVYDKKNQRKWPGDKTEPSKQVTMIIDKDGKIRFRNFSEKDDEKLRKGFEEEFNKIKGKPIIDKEETKYLLEWKRQQQAIDKEEARWLLERKRRQQAFEERLRK